MHRPIRDSGGAPGRRVLALRSSRPHPRRTVSSGSDTLVGVARDLDGRAENASLGAAYVPLFPEPLERFVPLHGREETQ